jgi:hypothetical protein
VGYAVDHIVRLGIPGYGNDELAFMEETILLCPPHFIGDWGTNRGSSARIFYEMTAYHHIACEVHTVELPLVLAPADHPGHQAGEFLEDLRVQVPQHEGDGVTVALEHSLGIDQPLFFLDGDHSLENVYREIRMIHRVRPEASMLLHDTQVFPGQAVRQFLGWFPGCYTMTELASQAGMMRLSAKP